MALNRSRVSLISLVLVGGLAFVACGSSSGSEDAGASASASGSASSAASASASSSASSSASTSAAPSVELTPVAVTDEAKEKLPDFVTGYFDTMRGGALQQLSETTQELLNKIQGDSGSSTADIVDSIDKNLSDEEKQSIIDDMRNGADPMYSLTDHAGLSQAQDIMLSLFMISQSTTLFQQTATLDEAQVKVTVDASKVTYDGSTASVPPSAMTTQLRESMMATATASPSMDAETEASSTLPLVWTNDGWRVDGKKYFDSQG